MAQPAQWLGFNNTESFPPSLYYVVHLQSCAEVSTETVVWWLTKLIIFFFALDGLRRILCNIVIVTKGDTDLLSRVLLSDSTLWKGMVTVQFIVFKIYKWKSKRVIAVDLPPPDKGISGDP